jgi:ATP-dependent helicase/nuclease subunit B
MDKILYFENLFSDRRSRLIEKCTDLQRAGKNFLYILPSREALRDVRYSIIKINKGMLNSKVIMFDELEKDIAEPFIGKENIINDDEELMILKDICENIGSRLNYYFKICCKDGFLSETKSFIKYLKRNCINGERLKEAAEGIEDTTLKSKLEDLHLIYEEYIERLKGQGLYDINDVSAEAVNYTGKSSSFAHLDTIVIDGFINIDLVNQKLIERITELGKVNIYVSCPYRNANSENFITAEIKNVFEGMGFEVVEDGADIREKCRDVSELALNLYSGQKADATSGNIRLAEYPCISAEVRETARCIKEGLMAGTAAEDIAIYFENREEYLPHIFSVFREFGIPAAQKREMKLSDSDAVRKALIMTQESGFSELSYEDWIKVLGENITLSAADTAEILKEACNQDLSFEKKFHLKAVQGCTELISGLAESIRLCGLESRILAKEEFIKIIKEYLQNTSFTMEPAESRGVKLLNTDMAKGIYHKHVFILGLNEGEFPSVSRSFGLFDEAESRALRAAGISFRDTLWELERDKIRFNLAVSSAEESLTLSWRSSDEDGKYSIASPFAEQVMYVTGISKVEKTSMRDRFDLAFDRSMSVEEMRDTLMKDISSAKYRGLEMEGSSERLSFSVGMDGSLNALQPAADAEFHRSRERDFNRLEGDISSEFSRMSGCSGNLTPSKIGRYQRCPFMYMMENIFELAAEEEEEACYSSMEIGSLYHQVLADYYRGLEDFSAIDEKRLGDCFSLRAGQMRRLDIAENVHEGMLSSLMGTLERFIGCDLSRMSSYNKKTGKLLRPYALEQQFDDSDIFGRKITCKIDRIDLEYSMASGKPEPTGRYIVYDYKKNSLPGIDSFINGNGLQMAIYYYLCEKFLKSELNGIEPECMAAIYLGIESTGKSIKKDGLYRTEYKAELDFSRSSFDMNKEYFTGLMQSMKLEISSIIGEMDSGRYPYRAMCQCFEKFQHSSCSFKDVCRYNFGKMEVLSDGNI